jgi:hypothetical protein
MGPTAHASRQGSNFGGRPERVSVLICSKRFLLFYCQDFGKEFGQLLHPLETPAPAAHHVFHSPENRLFFHTSGGQLHHEGARRRKLPR